MGRRNEKVIAQTDFRGGINTEPENARPNQVLDALNVWAPKGYIQLRPGTAVRVLVANLDEDSVPAQNDAYVAIYNSDDTSADYNDENVDDLFAGTGISGTFTYIGFARPTYTFTGMKIIATTPGTDNTANTIIGAAQYWNGAEWKDLPGGIIESTAVPTVLPAPRSSTSGYFCQATSMDVNGYLWYSWIMPPDAGQGALSAVSPSLTTEYGVRFKIAGVAPSINYAAMDYDINAILRRTGTSKAHAYVDTATQTNVLVVVRDDVDSVPLVAVYSGGGVLTTAGLTAPFDTSWDEVPVIDVPCVTPVSSFERIYITVGDQTLCWYNAPSGTPTLSAATVEDSASIVGSVSGIASTYNPKFVAQLAEWPAAKHWLFFKGVLICAGITDAPYTVRWSAPNDAHRVWPEESFEYFGDDDSSPITGLSSFGEHVVVFRQDSIWLLVDDGVNDIGIQQFRPIKIVDGTGCVSRATIKKIPGGLCFLSEDGVYLFDGQSARKISSQIDSLLSDNIAKSARITACAEHYKSNNCYVLTVPTVDPDVKKTYVYDYLNDAWWAWDNLEAVSWSRYEDYSDEEVLTYIDADGYIYDMNPDKQQDSYTPIAAHVETHRLGYGNPLTKRFGSVHAIAENTCGDLTVSIKPEDVTVGDSYTLKAAQDDAAVYGEARYSQNTYVTAQRRQLRVADRKTGAWATIKVENADNRTFNIFYLGLGVTPLGKR